MFDILAHAPWAGRGLLEGALVLDGFAGTGALGLEALSRGAAHAVFVEHDAQARQVLQANIAACGAGGRSTILGCDILRVPPGSPRALVFLDPPYGQDLLSQAVGSLGRARWIGEATIIVAEAGQKEIMPANGTMLAHRIHGAAQLAFWRETHA